MFLFFNDFQPQDVLILRVARGSPPEVFLGKGVLKLSLLSYVPSAPSCLTCLRALRAFAPYVLSCLSAFALNVPSRLTFLRALRAFGSYVPSCVTCLCALRALIFTRLNYAPYSLAFKCDKVSY